jgi:hypothetical protein
MRGSLHYATNGKTVRRFGRDDDFFREWREETIATAGPSTAPSAIRLREAPLRMTLSELIKRPLSAPLHLIHRCPECVSTRCSQSISIWYALRYVQTDQINSMCSIQCAVVELAPDQCAAVDLPPDLKFLVRRTRGAAIRVMMPMIWKQSMKARSWVWAWSWS